MKARAIILVVEIEHETMFVGVAIGPPDAAVARSRGRTTRWLYLDDVRAEFGQYPCTQFSDIASEIDDGEAGKRQRLWHGGARHRASVDQTEPARQIELLTGPHRAGEVEEAIPHHERRIPIALGGFDDWHQRQQLVDL